MNNYHRCETNKASLDNQKQCNNHTNASLSGWCKRFKHADPFASSIFSFSSQHLYNNLGNGVPKKINSNKLT